MEEERYLLRQRDTLEEQSEEEWSDSSDSNSYCSSDSSIPEWEPYIDDNGRVYFIDCHPSATTSENEKPPQTLLKSNQNRKSTRGKFLRLIRRRESKRRSGRRLQKSEENKVTFRDQEEGEIKVVTLHVDNNKKLGGRRAKLIETIFGILTSTFSDGERLMIAGFTPDSVAKNEKNIKIGDYLKSINGIDVTVSNLNSVLEDLSVNEVKLQLQRVTGVEVTEPKLVDINKELEGLLLQQPIGILYINIEELSEDGSEFEEVLYCYPKPLNKNSLCLSRGAFITLNHLIQEITGNKVQLSSVIINNRLIHIVFNQFGSKLLLLMLPNNRLIENEVLLLNNELLQLLHFQYHSLDECFHEKNQPELDHFFSRFFARILCSGLWGNANQSINLKNFDERCLQNGPYQFEDLLPCGQLLSLPSEARMQIDDALNELEASDYREWNEDPLDCQRLFTILGSALYHSGHLITSHFVHTDLIKVNLYCKQQGLFHLSSTEPLRSLIIWREVFSSCQEILDDSRRYLLVVGSGKNLLAVIMEAGGCTEPPENDLAPDAFYVEEVQATLAHLQELGISELASQALANNPGTQVTVPEVTSKKKFLANINFKPAKENLISPQIKKPEVTSILKNRPSDQGVSTSASILSLAEDSELQSEDSISQGGYSERSEVSDEPVVGRRALREANKNTFDASDEESDIDDYRDGSQISSSSYDLTELRQSLLNDTNDADLCKLTAGKDPILYHFVQLDLTQGILINPPKCKVDSKTLEFILNQFRKCCQDIHTLFQNALRFKDIPSQDMTKSVMNKSLIAIKEYGSLFETNFQDECQKKNAKISYWVIGRLFHMPHPREVYVCYQDTIAQNIIEIAFQIGVSMNL